MRITSCLCALLLITVLPLAAHQQIAINPGDAPMQMLMAGRTPKTGTGRLRGRILAADTGSVVRRAQVRISSPDIGTKTAMTDAQGRYEFKDLPAGRFNVSVSKSGYVTMQYGQSRPFEPGRPIELADAQVMDKADISLPRGSAVQGHIVDEFGEPVADASVSAMRMQYAGGKRRLMPAGRNSTTNDQGYFRLYGLPPGEYYISATLRTMDSFVMDMLGGAGGPTGSNNGTGYAATYYPGTASPVEAQRLSLALGQELSNVDIPLQPVRLAKVSGLATASDGTPMNGALVMLMPSMKDAVALAPGGTSRTDKNGNFTLSGIAPGDYSLQIQSMAALMSAATQAMSMIGGTDAAPAGSRPQPAEREFATATLTVSGDDIANLVVTATRGATATGRIVFEGGPAPETLSTLRLIAEPTDTDNMPATASIFGNALVKDDGTFAIESLVGGRTLRLMNLPKGWSIKEVLHQNMDVTDSGYDFKPGDNVDGFEIVLTNKTQTLSGSVIGTNGGAVREYTVVVFAEDPEKWSAAESRWVSSARADQQGQFRIADLPAGSYLAVAVEYVAQGEWRDPAWLARAAKVATRLTLEEGASKTLALSLSGS